MNLNKSISMDLLPAQQECDYDIAFYTILTFDVFSVNTLTEILNIFSVYFSLIDTVYMINLSSNRKIASRNWLSTELMALLQFKVFMKNNQFILPP